jgi:hypothetical protein
VFFDEQDQERIRKLYYFEQQAAKFYGPQLAQPKRARGEPVVVAEAGSNPAQDEIVGALLNQARKGGA